MRSPVKKVYLLHLCFSEGLMNRTVLAIKSKALDFNFLILSDGWMSKARDAEGNLTVDKERFPNGMKYISTMVSTFLSCST